VQFLSRGSGYALFLSHGNVVLNLERQPPSPAAEAPVTQGTAADTLRKRLTGASAGVGAVEQARRTGVVSYIIGNDLKKWRAAIPTHGKVDLAVYYVNKEAWMDNLFLARNPQRGARIDLRAAVMHLCLVALLTIIAVLSANGQARSDGAEPVAEPAIPAILAAFDRYDVVGMPAAHGLKDLDDLILMLVRNPAFWKKVNDIEIECGNSLYQDLLDRYTSGGDVPLREVQKVWRNTTQPPCGLSGFYEQLVPLVRAINQKLPRDKALRILAGDPPFDWDQIKTAEDLHKAVLSLRRDTSIASVLEREALARHRKVLVLMGTLHMLHGAGAIAMYERKYPNSTFVISELGTFGTNLTDLSNSPFAAWPIPALARIKATWLGRLDLSKFLPPPNIIDQDCNPHNDFPAPLRKPVEELFDAVLYLGPQDLRLWEKVPADIVLDSDYMKERRRRSALPGSPTATTVQTSDGLDRQIFDRAENPLFKIDASPASAADIEQAVRDCRERKRQPPK